METKKVYSVSEITGLIRIHLEAKFPSVSVRGEVSNLRVQSSGHAYFTLKDANTIITCVCFKNYWQRQGSSIKDGDQIQVMGALKVYEPRGNYQINVIDLRPDGLGNLHAEYERRKKVYEEKGYFDESRKRPLPFFPKRVGLVTSASGAALQDMLHVMNRRFSVGIEILVQNCRVQGTMAAAEIARAIELLQGQVDVILLARGGGSIEDLWSFNEDLVVEAVFCSKVPVISGVGHETDFTLVDFVADVRAPTPSAAAELSVPDRVQLLAHVGRFARMAQFQGSQVLLGCARRLNGYGVSDLKTLFQDRLERRVLDLDYLRARLESLRVHYFLNQRAKLDMFKKENRIKSVLRFLEFKKRDLIPMDQRRVSQVMLQRIDSMRSSLKAIKAQLLISDPAEQLRRGYSWLLSNGTVIHSINQLEVGQDVSIRLMDGSVLATVRQLSSEGETNG